MPRRTALIVPVPEAEPAVGAFRLEHDPFAALGVPAHVTVLFPFAPPEAVDEEAVAELLGRFPAFDFVLDRIERFEDGEGAVWLHPEPSTPFVDLTAAVAQRWPDFPPYGGAFDGPIPHRTVSTGPIDLAVALPIPCRARAVVLIEESEESGRWQERRVFPLRDQGVA
jgi:2'-5' RNA ligase superfamily